MSAAPKLSTFMEGFSTSERAREKGTFVYFDYVRMTGDANAALLLAQIVYWTPRAKVYRDGKFWIAKTYQEWTDEIGISKVRTVRTAFNKLIEYNLIEKTVYRFGDTDNETEETTVRTVLHTRLNQEVFEQLLKSIQDERAEIEGKTFQSDAERHSGIDAQRQSADDENRTSINRRVTQDNIITPDGVIAGKPANDPHEPEETGIHPTVQELDDAMFGNASQSPKPDAVRATSDKTPIKKHKKTDRVPAAQMNPMKDAIATAFNWSWDTMTKSNKGTIQRAAKELCQAGATPEHIPFLYQFCKRNFDNISPMALSSQWSNFQAKHKRRLTGDAEGRGRIPPINQPGYITPEQAMTRFVPTVGGES